MMSGGATSHSGFGGYDFGGGSTGKYSNTGRSSSKRKVEEDLDITKTLNITAQDVFSKRPISVTFTDMSKCGFCNGGGYCSHCGGTGILATPKTVKVNLPKDIAEGKKIRLKGEGKTDNYGRKGDLYLIIHFKDSEYQIDGSNLTKDVEITPPEAVLGCSKDIKTLHGNINIKIPAGVSTGQALRLKGLGLPDGNSFGVLNAKIKIVVPKNYSQEIKDLYKKIQELS